MAEPEDAARQYVRQYATTEAARRGMATDAVIALAAHFGMESVTVKLPSAFPDGGTRYHLRQPEEGFATSNPFTRWMKPCRCRSYHRRTGEHAEGCPRR